jgi:hypothetical protein
MGYHGSTNRDLCVKELRYHCANRPDHGPPYPMPVWVTTVNIFPFNSPNFSKFGSEPKNQPG